MKVVMVEPGQYARIEELDTGLESLQKAVGGLIDCAYPWKDMACVVCNDEGLINGMPLNREVPDYGPIAGPFFVCGIEGENFCSLTDEQADKYKKMFLQPELFVPYKDGLIRLAYLSLSRTNQTQQGGHIHNGWPSRKIVPLGKLRSSRISTK